MNDNIAIGPDAQLNHALSLVRSARAEGGIGAGHVPLAPEVFIHSDPALTLDGRYTSPEGRLFDFEVKVAGEGGWIALHCNLGARDLTHQGVLGFACRSIALETQVVQPCLRSGTDEGFVDCFFDKHILSTPEERSHVDALAVHQREAIPTMAPWRELVLFLPTKTFHWSLMDLRIFVV